jgi:hypothetical protein
MHTYPAKHLFHSRVGSEGVHPYIRALIGGEHRSCITGLMAAMAVVKEALTPISKRGTRCIKDGIGLLVGSYEGNKSTRTSY